MIAFRKLLRANIVSFRRDRATLFWTFAFPLLFIVIFGAVFGSNNTPNYSVGLAVEAHGAAADAVANAIERNKAFSVHVGSRDDELKKLRNGDRRAVILLGPQGQGALPVSIFSDPAQTTTQQILLPLVQQTVGAVNDRLAGSQPAVVLQVQSIGTKDLKYIDFFVPGILAMAIMQLGLFSAIPLVTQRETKVLRRLSATPLPRRTVIAAQVVQRVVISVIQALILLSVGRILFHLKITGSMPAVLVFVVLGSLAFVAMGYVLASQAKTAESAQPLVQIVQFPMLFLSGVFFPAELAPKIIQPLVRALPLTYLGDALRQVAVNATPLNPLWVDAAVLTGWLAVCLVAAVRLFRWE